MRAIRILRICSRIRWDVGLGDGGIVVDFRWGVGYACGIVGSLLCAFSVVS
jgi:hypothetical protein